MKPPQGVLAEFRIRIFESPPGFDPDVSHTCTDPRVAPIGWNTGNLRLARGEFESWYNAAMARALTKEGD